MYSRRILNITPLYSSVFNNVHFQNNSGDDMKITHQSESEEMNDGGIKPSTNRIHRLPSSREKVVGTFGSVLKWVDNIMGRI